MKSFVDISKDIKRLYTMLIIFLDGICIDKYNSHIFSNLLVSANLIIKFSRGGHGSSDD